MRPKERFERGAKGDEACEAGHNGLKAAVINLSLRQAVCSRDRDALILLHGPSKPRKLRVFSVSGYRYS
jgi:hypothetical protein